MGGQAGAGGPAGDAEWDAYAEGGCRGRGSGYREGSEEAKGRDSPGGEGYWEFLR